MAFLDNSGDIILDAVLTDHGRKELAKGDGSFQITKFALADEEIDYSLYNVGHNSGSAYYDLEILQTPILESFTDNAASIKTRLITYDNLELKYLPMCKLNTGTDRTMQTSGSYWLCANEETYDNGGSPTIKTGVGVNTSDHRIQGFIDGYSGASNAHIRIDQGLDVNYNISPLTALDPELRETSYVVQMDNRLMRLASADGSATLASPDYVDDDDIAYYTLEEAGGGGGGFTFVRNNNNPHQTVDQAIRGPRGTSLFFKPQVSLDVNTSSYLFTLLGGTDTLDNRGGLTTDIYYMDTTIRIQGVDTGAFVDVAVRIIRNQ
jgi:hypothetical protein